MSHVGDISDDDDNTQLAENQVPIDPSQIAQYITGDEFGHLTSMLSWKTFSTCKRVVNSDGTFTYLTSFFKLYDKTCLDRNATRYILSPRLYASLEAPMRENNFKDRDHSWALRSQTTEFNMSHLYRMGPSQPSDRFYDNFVYVSNMSQTEFEKHVEFIGGIPYSSFYII